MKQFEIYSIEDWQLVLNELNPRPGMSIGLSGPLSAGKTTFTQLVGARCGIGDIASPTYQLNQVYKYPEGRLSHWDLYRLDSPGSIQSVLEDVRADISHPRTITVIEWIERAPMLENKLTKWLKIQLISHTQRLVEVYP